MKSKIHIAGLALGFLTLGSSPLGAQGTLPHSSLAEYIVELKARIPGAGSEAFIEPTLTEREAFVPCLRLMLAGDTAGATACMESLNFAVNILVDAGRGKSYLVAEERAEGYKGFGTYIVDSLCERNILIVVPHPLYDINTPEQGQKIFQEIGARGLFISGTHRCANAAVSPCSGTTSTCGGGPYRVSDASHYDLNLLHAAHEAALGLAPPPRAFHLHGQASEPMDIVLSDGTTAASPGDAEVNRLRAALLARGASTGSCNWPQDAGLTLCGTECPAGRLYNGSASPCIADSVAASGLFLHLEQKRSIRDDPSVLIAAMTEVFPADWPPGPPLAPGNLTASGQKRRIALTWQASGGASGYRVLRSATRGGPYAQLGDLVAETTYVDGSVVRGKTYYYVVTAVSTAGESPSSNEASAASR